MTFWASLGPLGAAPASSWVPDGPWPTGSPESQGLDAAVLAGARGIQHGVVVRRGVEVFTYGDAGHTLDWASCNRTWVDKLWGRWITLHGGLAWLDRNVGDLPCQIADWPPNLGACVKHVASYTSLPPVGDAWRYSSGDWWPWQARALAQLCGVLDVAQAWALELEPHLGGSSFQPGVADDGTLRVKASCRDNARLGGLILNRGVGTHGQLIDPAYIDRSVAGGPDGTAYPFAWEGFQTHLIRDQRCNAGSSNSSPQWVDLPGVPDGALALDGNADPDHGWGAIVAIPSLELVVAARGATPAWWLSTICKAAA